MASLKDIYDVLAEEEQNRPSYGTDYAKLGRGRVAAAVMGDIGGMFGQQAARAFGRLSPAQQKEQAMADIAKLHPNPTTYSDFVAMANEFKNRGMMEAWEKVMEVAKQVEDQDKGSEYDDALSFLERDRGVKLDPTEAAYFKSRVKKDVSVTMGGQVIDTAPNVFDQIVAARPEGAKDTKDGIADTALTGATMDAAVSKLSEKMVKADLSDLDTALADAEDMFAKYGDKDVPGLSKLELVSRQTEEGSQNAAKVESVKNILLKLRSGAAVTQSEAKRFLGEITSATVVTDTMWKDWIRRIRELVEAKKQEIFAGERDDVKQEYWNRGGVRQFIQTKYEDTKPVEDNQKADLLKKYGIK